MEKRFNVKNFHYKVVEPAPPLTMICFLYQDLTWTMIFLWCFWLTVVDCEPTPISQTTHLLAILKELAPLLFSFSSEIWITNILPKSFLSREVFSYSLRFDLALKVINQLPYSNQNLQTLSSSELSCVSLLVSFSISCVTLISPGPCLLRPRSISFSFSSRALWSSSS